MSAIVMFFYWVVIPVGVFRLARWLFFRGEGVVKKGSIVVGTLCFFAWFLWIAIGRNMWLDHQVREMCAKDGGIKVYETVALTPDLLDWAGRIHIPSKAYIKPEDKYYYESFDEYFRKKNPEIRRHHIKIIRQYDRKIIGEATSYHRRGGGLPGPWHPSSYRCPLSSDLYQSTFRNPEK